MNIYLDIDGVIIGRNGEAAPHALELLKVLTEKHKCFWLTTHCHGGQNRAPEYLADKLPAEAEAYIAKISPTEWGSWKTDAIDFGQDFRWLDDDIYAPELKALADHDCQNKLIKIDLGQNPDQLKDIIVSLSGSLWK